MISGIILNNTPPDKHFIVCKGEFWVSRDFIGEIFMTLHVVFIIISSVQAEKVFFGVPKKLGYFDKKVQNRLKV